MNINWGIYGNVLFRIHSSHFVKNSNYFTFHLQLVFNYLEGFSIGRVLVWQFVKAVRNNLEMYLWEPSILLLLITVNELKQAWACWSII